MIIRSREFRWFLALALFVDQGIHVTKAFSMALALNGLASQRRKLNLGRGRPPDRKVAMENVFLFTLWRLLVSFPQFCL